MFDVMKESELMGIIGGNHLVPYYNGIEAFRRRQPSGTTWTSSSRIAYFIGNYYYDSNNNLLGWY